MNEFLNGQWFIRNRNISRRIHMKKQKRFFGFVQRNSEKFFHFWISTSQPRSYRFPWSLKSCDFSSTFAFSFMFQISREKKIPYYYWLLILLAWIQCLMYALCAMCCFLLSSISNFKGDASKWECYVYDEFNLWWWYELPFEAYVFKELLGLLYSFFFFALSRPFNIFMGNMECILQFDWQYLH